VGSQTVRGFGMACDGGTTRSCLHSESGDSTAKNMARTIDAIEEKLNVRFGGAHITGNFGPVESVFGKNTICFPRPRRLGQIDVCNAIFNSRDARCTANATLHLIPLQFLVDGGDVANMRDISCGTFSVRFNAITYPDEIIEEIKRGLMSACVPPLGFYDPIYLLGKAYHKKNETAVFIDFGKTKTSVGVCKNRGLVERFDIGMGQDEITKKISADFGIRHADAEKIKLDALNVPPAQSDEYVSASDIHSSITRSDVWNAWNEANERIMDEILGGLRTDSRRMFITGAGTTPDNIYSLILKNKGLEEITILDEYAVVGAFGNMFKQNMGIKRREPAGLKPRRNVPIIPSVMCWDIGNAYLYKMFSSVGINKIHMDIMDGFYTTRVSGTLDDMRKIRARTPMRMHAHLMVDDPMAWIEPVARHGADTIILSSGTRNIVGALKKIKMTGKECGLALHPDFDLGNLRKELLFMLDEVMVMGVAPGASGQQFRPETPKRIRIIANTRAKYGFDYRISADGGINDETAQLCWDAGADFLVSGSFLHNAPDFADAVVKLLPKR
jgi:ribulose-phosphate 3-epimerase